MTPRCSSLLCSQNFRCRKPSASLTRLSFCAKSHENKYKKIKRNTLHLKPQISLAGYLIKVLTVVTCPTSPQNLSTNSQTNAYFRCNLPSGPTKKAPLFPAYLVAQQVSRSPFEVEGNEVEDGLFSFRILGIKKHSSLFSKFSGIYQFMCFHVVFVPRGFCSGIYPKTPKVYLGSLT